MHIEEPQRQTKVTGEYDVVVAGGGIAGVTAAVAAARNSARVCLIERYCGLGGLATLGNVTIWLPICDGKGRQVIGGLGEELLKLSVADLKKDHPAARFNRVPECWKDGGDPEERKKKRYLTEFNPASYMLALEELVVKSGVDLMYDTRICSVRREGEGISHVIIENKDGRSAISGKTVIDTTGDADICSFAGEETVSLDSNVLCGWFYSLIDGELKLYQNSNNYSPMADKEGAKGPFFRGDDAKHVTEHILQTRQIVREKMADLREKHPEEDPQLIMPTMMACFRMTRRLAGTFAVGEEHMHQWFDDAIGLTGDWRKSGPVYAIPLRCIRAVKNANLLVAGRCIAVEKNAWDVMRAIPPCAVTGQAAGTAAALASLKNGGDIGALDFATLTGTLKEQGVLLDPELVKA